MNNKSLIFGAPGCGKTTYLIKLLDNLLKEYSPNEIAFVSFTKKGSYEGRDRAIKEFGYKESDFPFFRTIHSLAFRELGISKYEIISKRHYKDFSRAMGMNFVGYYTEDFVNNDDKYLFMCSLYKNNYSIWEKMSKEMNRSLFQTVFNNYTRFKNEMGIMDFDDLLVDFIQSRQSLPVKVVIIDEAQDLTTLQWKFCELAFKECEKTYIAGDDDQAIYEWSGADVKYFLSLVNKSRIYTLDKSYRLKSNILEFSKKPLFQIKERMEKFVEPINQGGKIKFYNRLEDIHINSEETYYFLSRNNYFLKEYVNYLRKSSVTFYYKDKYSVNLTKIKMIKRYEYLRKHKIEDIKKEPTLMNFLKKDKEIGDVWYNIFNLTLEESNYYRDLFRDKTDINKCNIMVNTIHGVKGGEADNVVLKLDITKNTFNNISMNIDSESRCIYVALTRARKNIHIIYGKTKFNCSYFL